MTDVNSASFLFTSRFLGPEPHTCLAKEDGNLVRTRAVPSIQLALWWKWRLMGKFHGWRRCNRKARTNRTVACFLEVCEVRKWKTEEKRKGVKRPGCGNPLRCAPNENYRRAVLFQSVFGIINQPSAVISCLQRLGSLFHVRDRPSRSFNFGPRRKHGMLSHLAVP